MKFKLNTRLAFGTAIVLFWMALAQLTTLRSHDPVLSELDPLIHLSGHRVLLIAGCMGLLSSGLLLLLRGGRIGFGFTAILAGLLLVHRFFLQSHQAPNFTDCLGNFNDWFPLAPQTLRVVWWASLFLVLVGSITGLIAVANGKENEDGATEFGTASTGTPGPAEPSSSLRRLLRGWCLGGIVLGAFAGALQLRIQMALPRDFQAKFDEITSIGTFRDIAVGNLAGTRLLYAREIDNGVGLFLGEIPPGEKRRIGVMDDSLSTPDSAFRLIGWSPNERHLAIAIDSLDTQTIAVCSGDAGKLERTFALLDDQKQAKFHTLQEIKRALWLGNDKIVVMDCTHSVYVADLNNNRLQEIIGYTTIHRDTGDRIGDFTLAATSDHTIALSDSGIIWEIDVNSGQGRKLLELPSDARIQWLDYDPGSRRFLFSQMMARPKSPDKIRVLCQFDTNATPPVTEISDSNILKGQWILGGAGIAYVTGGSVGTVMVDTQNIALRTNLFVGGFVWNYCVSPGRDKLFAQAKEGSEPFSLWEYDIAKHTLQRAVPGLEQTLAHAKIASRVDSYTDDAKVPYTVIAPTDLDPTKKYPVLLDQPSESHYTQDAQFFANSGIYYVTVQEDGLEKILSVYNQILKIPNADPARIYITGSSFRTETLSQAVNLKPGMWRGLIFLSPIAFPEIPDDTSTYPSVFVSVGTKDDEGALPATVRFTSKACARLLRMKVVYHDGAPHIFNSTKLARERFSAIVEFILAGS